LILFGLPFFLVGIGLLFWLVIPTLYEHQQMQSWPSVNGTLTHAELHSGTSDGSTTYRADAQYSYNVRGRDYEHDRVAINGGSDNISDFQENLGRHLQNLYQQQYPVTVYYNPDNPADAVLNRDLRIWLLAFQVIFLLIFGGVGAGIIYWGLRGKKTIETPEAADKPWLTRPEWQQGAIRSDAKSGTIFIWIFTSFWNLISLPAAALVISDWQKHGTISLLILLFPVIGLFLLYQAIKLTREWKRFGITLLTMDPFPGSINGDVGGKIQVKLPYHSGMVCKVTLSNIHSYMSGSGKNRSRHESVKWQSDGYARIKPSANGVDLEFRFEVPEGLRESEEMANSYYLWRLNVEIDMDGVDLDRSFEIPVYNTNASSRYISINSSQEQPVGLPKITAESLLPLSHEGGKKILYYPILRKPGRSLMILVFGGIFAGMGAFLWIQAATAGFMLYFMSFIFSLVGWGIVISALYLAFNSLTVSMNGHELISVRSILGIAVRTQQILYANVQSVEAIEGIKSNSGKKHKIEYNIIARIHNKKITLAEHLDSTRSKDLVIEYFENEFS